MNTETAQGQVRMIVDGHVCVITLDNVAKKNAITPEILNQLSKHLTTFDDNDDLWVVVMSPAG